MMRAPNRSPQPHFSQPVRQITLMLVVLALVVIGGWFAYAQIYPIFHINPLLNGVIGGVFLFGVLACFWQVWQLITAVVWIESYAANRQGRPQYRAPLLLAPLATLLGSRGASRKIATTASRSILESVATRIDEARDITRYLTSLLIFLGLLGTFYGLATTVPGVVDTIRALAPQPGEEASDLFERLMTGLESQLGGMGTAFSSSLIGLGGSLVLGLLELFVGHGQNRFYRELEEWISSITRLSFSTGEGTDGEGSATAEILDQMAEQMDGLHAMFAQGQADRAQTEQRLDAVAGALNRLAQETASEREERQTQTMALRQIASGQSRLTEALERLSDQMGANQDSDADAEVRARLRSIDTYLPRLLEEISAGRQENAAEVRNGLAALTRSLLSAKES